MTKRLLKTKQDHKRMRAVLTENTVTQTMTPAAGALDAGEEGVAHAGVTFAMSAPVGEARYSVSAGAIPTDMEFDGGAGTLTGTPSAAGAYSFSVTGTDAFGNSVTNAYTMDVT